MFRLQTARLFHWDECQWTQKAKSLGVDSVQDFLNNAGGIQDQMVIGQMSLIEREYDSGNFNQYVGQVRNGVTMTKETIMYLIHNGGPGTARAYLQGRNNDPEQVSGARKMNDCMGGATSGTTPTGSGFCV